MDLAIKKTPIGIIVGRFQVHELHEGHHSILKSVIDNHDKVVVFLGVSPAKGTKNNPLDYKSREQMLHESYPDLTIIPIKDVNNDEEWSKTLDDKIREIFAIGAVTLYGSRDGFIPHYRGQFPTVELQARFKVSGSEIRESLKDKSIADKNFRHGRISACFDKYPITFSTVDAAILDGNGNVLLARKKQDPKDKWRFIGGFIDAKTDLSAEEAVKREVMEETGSLGVGEPEYIGTAAIDDWRYRNEQDGIMTTLFAIPYIFGKPRASDDINELEWFNIEKLVKSECYQMVEEHKVLFEKLNKFLEKKNK